MLIEKITYLCNYIAVKRAGLEFPVNAKICGRLHISAQANASFQVGKNVIINSGWKENPAGGDKTHIFIGKDAILKIGDGAGISNSTIFCKKEINIGNNVNIGADCLIYDTDMHSVDYRERIGFEKENVLTQTVTINDGAWIGGSCIILKGVTVGARAVIGAGSLVTKDVPADELWAGNPAKFVRKLHISNRDS